MGRPADILIAKREGGLEPFQQAKPHRCLVAAMKAQRRDHRLAGPLVQALRLHMLKRREPGPVSAEYVFRCVHAVLTDTGLGDVAERLARHRRRRAERRRRVRVLAEQAGEPRPWSKAAIVETLQGRFGLSYETSRILASEIERRILALDYRLVSATLVEELIRGELLAWGLACDPTPADRPAAVPRPGGEGA